VPALPDEPALDASTPRQLAARLEQFSVAKTGLPLALLGVLVAGVYGVIHVRPAAG